MRESARDEEQAVFRLLLDVSTKLSDQLDDRLRQRDGLTLTDFEVLRLLSEADGGRLRMSDLARLSLMSRSRLTYRIDRLEKLGLVERTDSDDDGRGVLAVATPEGLERFQTATPGHLDDLSGLLFDDLDADDVANLYRVLAMADEQLSSDCPK